MIKNKILYLDVYNRCSRLKKLYNNSKQTGKTQIMKYCCLDNNIVILDKDKVNEFKKAFQQYDVSCVVSTLDDIEECERLKNRRLHVDHYIIEKLLDDVLELLESVDGEY